MDIKSLKQYLIIDIEFKTEVDISNFWLSLSKCFSEFKSIVLKDNEVPRIRILPNINNITSIEIEVDNIPDDIHFVNTLCHCLKSYFSNKFINIRCMIQQNDKIKIYSLM